MCSAIVCGPASTLTCSSRSASARPGEQADREQRITPPPGHAASAGWFTSVNVTAIGNLQTIRAAGVICSGDRILAVEAGDTYLFSAAVLRAQ